MMCYRDMTFCKEKDCNEFATCHRAYTDEVDKSAQEWWTYVTGSPDGAPVAYFMEKPNCFLEK